jgi:hypothetical protein
MRTSLGRRLGGQLHVVPVELPEWHLLRVHLALQKRWRLRRHICVKYHPRSAALKYQATAGLPHPRTGGEARPAGVTMPPLPRRCTAAAPSFTLAAFQQSDPS